MAISDDRHIAAAKKQYQTATSRLQLAELCLREAKDELNEAEMEMRRARAAWDNAMDAYLRRRD